MTTKSFVCAAFGLLLASGAAEALYGSWGNDTGGIIPWSRETERMAYAIAQDNCAAWNKYAVIRSVRRVPGDYIAYACRFDPPRWYRYRR